jgi:hypothetical protein
VAIRLFCIRKEETDWVRCLVCGVLWLPENEIAINAQQLKHVLGKCKSSINGTFKQMQYDGVPLGPEQVKRITTAIPYLKFHPLELRQSSIRRFTPRQQMNDVPSQEKTNDATLIDQNSVEESECITGLSGFEYFGQDQDDSGSQNVEGKEEWNWYDGSFWN